MLNKIFIMGRLTRDPELRRTQSGTPVTSFSLAVDRDFKSQSGEKETDFIDVVAWRSTAEFVSKYFTKGRMAAIHDAVDLTVHVLQHVMGRGGTGAAGGIAAGSGHRYVRFTDDCQRYRMIGAADAHRFQPAGSAQRYNGAAGQDHGQRAGPKMFRQRIGCRRNILTVSLQPIGAGNMKDQGIILRAALGLKNMQYRCFVKGIGAKTVHRFRGDAQ